MGALAAEASHAVTVLHELAAPAASEDLAIAPAVLATSAQDALASAGVVVTDARAKLGDWTAEVARIELDKQAQLAALSSYRDAAYPPLDRYRGICEDSHEFVGRIGEDGSNFEEVYGFLDTERIEHEDVRNVLATLVPPPAVAGAHAGLLEVMDLAVQELANAAAGTAEYVWTNGMEHYRDAPAWQRFAQESPAMTTGFAGAVATWEARMAEEQLRLTAITPPLKPAV